MRNGQRCALMILVCSVFLEMTNNCQISKYIDDCGSRGLLWNCSGLNISKLPTSIPPDLHNSTVTLDLSFNQFSSLTGDTFRQLAAYTHVTSIILHHNKLTDIQNLTFQNLSSLCSLDISFANLDKTEIDVNAFSFLQKLQILRIHQNNFQSLGYPDLQISKLHSLKHLKIDTFSGFAFTKPFQNLTSLSQLEFNNVNDFKLTNTSFQGLILSPIYSINMDFSDHVDCDIPEDLFCSFPYLHKDIQINFGGKCSVLVVLRSLKCLQHRKIQKLDLSGNKESIEADIIILDDRSVEYLLNMCVSVLLLGNNDIISIKTNIYKSTLWTCLDTLNLSHNDIQNVESKTILAFLTCPLLRNLSWCCNVQSPHVESYNSINRILGDHLFIDINLPNNLQIFDYSNNYIHNIDFKPFRVRFTGKQLQNLYLAKTNFPLMFENVFNFSSLIILDLSQNEFRNIHPDIFQGVKNIQELYAIDVHLEFTDSLFSESLFRNLHFLTKLDISQNRLSVLPPLLLRDQKKSLKEIHLDHDMFSSVSNSLLQLENLETIYVRNNLVSKISENDQRFFKSQKNISIFLEGNPISCICSNIKSLKWMKDRRHLFSDLSKTLCVESKSAVSELFNDNKWRSFELQCQTVAWLIFSVGLLVLTVLTLTITAVIRRYRVHLEYVILRIKQRWKGVQIYRHEDVFSYDVYVSYSDVDYPWLIQNLYPKFEKMNLKTWLKDKDSTPGSWESEEIVNCINMSRKVMFIVSESFLDIGWSSFAVQMAITHAFHNHRQGSIVVIIKDELPLDKLPNEIKNIWWCIEHCRWPENETNEEIILSKLCNVLKISNIIE
nr:toll-like receptor 4 [Crassostrea gigas]